MEYRRCNHIEVHPPQDPVSIESSWIYPMSKTLTRRNLKNQGINLHKIPKDGMAIPINILPPRQPPLQQVLPSSRQITQ